MRGVAWLLAKSLLRWKLQTAAENLGPEDSHGFWWVPKALRSQACRYLYAFHVGIYMHFLCGLRGSRYRKKRVKRRECRERLILTTVKAPGQPAEPCNNVTAQLRGVNPNRSPKSQREPTSAFYGQHSTLWASCFPHAPWNPAMMQREKKTKLTSAVRGKSQEVTRPPSEPIKPANAPPWSGADGRGKQHSYESRPRREKGGCSRQRPGSPWADIITEASEENSRRQEFLSALQFSERRNPVKLGLKDEEGSNRREGRFQI